MKTIEPIQIRAGDLKPALTGLGKVVPRTTPLPTLQHVKIEPAGEGLVRFTATDLDVRLTMDLPAETAGPFEEYLVPLARLREQVRCTRADDAIVLRPVAKVPPVKEFPEAPGFRVASTSELGDRIPTSLLRAFECASRDETRHILRGALLDVSAKGRNAHRIVGTNGRTLYSSNSMELPKLRESIILPAHKVWQWKPLAGSRPWTLRVGPGKEGDVPFRIDGPFWSLTGRTLEGNYPSYQQVIPTASAFRTTVDLTDEMVEAMAGLIPKLPGRKRDNSPIGIHVEKGLVSLLAREEKSEPWQFYPIGKAPGKGKDNVIFVNRDYALRALTFGLHRISITDASSPMQFSREGDLIIVMPLREPDAANLKCPRGLKPLVEQSGKPRAKAPTKKRAAAPPSRKKPSKKKATTDPIREAESRLAEANESLATIGKQLGSASGSLKTARKQRGRDRSELKGFRSLFSTIKDLTRGSN